MIFILFLIAFIIPRISIFILWFFTNWFQGVFNTFWIPILGFIFMPATLLWYSVVINYFDNNWTAIPIIGIVIAVLVDLSPAKTKRYRD